MIISDEAPPSMEDDEAWAKQGPPPVGTIRVETTPGGPGAFTTASGPVIFPAHGSDRSITEPGLLSVNVSTEINAYRSNIEIKCVQSYIDYVPQVSISGAVTPGDNFLPLFGKLVRVNIQRMDMKIETDSLLTYTIHGEVI